MRGNVSEGRALADAALALGGGRPEARVRAANGAGILAGEQGDFTAARAHFEESLALARELGEPDREARASNNLAILALYEGDYEAAMARYEEGTEVARQTGDRRGLSLMLLNLGIASDGAGHHERALEYLEEAMEIARDVDDAAHLGSIQRSFARVLLDVDAPRALALLHESLEIARAHADRDAIVEVLETAAAAADPATGALLWGAAAALRAESGAIRRPDDEPFAAQIEGRLREALGPDAFAAGLAEGAALTLDDAVERALAI
jgi:tetratricopeptide (TPR) repeat protein